MKLGKLNAITVYIAWIAMAGLVSLGLLTYLDISLGKNFYNILFNIFIGSAVLHIILTFFVRCPHCNKCITTQGFKAPHPDSDGNWANVVAKWFSGSVVCIHCGQQVNTNDL